jgi:hypothetical protein
MLKLVVGKAASGLQKVKKKYIYPVTTNQALE